MNKLIIIVAIALVGITSAYAQNSSSTTNGRKLTEVLVPEYKLFPTTNMWTFLKLNTRKGLIRMVQYSLEEKNRFEVPINYRPLASGENAIPGRFNLYPTQNMWTFILLDEIDGRTWQVQWSLDGKEGIMPINANNTF